MRRLVLCLLAGCHVTTYSELTRPSVISRTPHPERAVAHAPKLVLTDRGTLRFVEPLACPTEELVSLEHGREVTVGPNLATFVVGVIATSVGGVLAVTGFSGDDAAANPLTYAGLGGLVVGVPLAIGPWIGNATILLSGDPATQSTRPGPEQPCGERALTARTATLTMRGIEVHGAIAADGTFAVSPYQLVDVYDTKAVPSWSITAVVDGTRTIEADIDSATLATAAPAFLAHADFDPAIGSMQLVPGLVPGTLRASLTSIPTGAALRIVLPLTNEGPGPAYAVRGHVSSATRAVDGRVLYVGKLAKGAAVTRELLIPLSPQAAMALRGASIELAVELRDAHGTAPAAPIRFQGVVFGDAPR